jgi:hypothetical protein
MPQGREIHSLPRYTLPSLDEDTLMRMKAPAKTDDDEGNEDSSDDDDELYPGQAAQSAPAGAFPGTAKDYAAAGGTYF